MRLERPEFRNLSEAAERHLSATEGVASVALFGMGEAQRPVAVAWPREDWLDRRMSFDLHTTLRFALENAAFALEPALRPQAVVVALSKAIDREQARRQLAAGGEPWPRFLQSDQRSDAPLGASTVAWVEAAFEAQGVALHGVDEWRRSTSLEFDLELDSLDRLQLCFAVAGASNRPLENEQDLHSLGTLGEIEDRLALGPGSAHVPNPRLDLFRLKVTEGQRTVDVPLTAGWPLMQVARFLTMPLFRAAFELRVVGIERVDWDRLPLIVAQNHASYLDPPLLASALPAGVHRRTMFLGHEGMFDRNVGRLLSRAFKVQPISCGWRAASALRSAQRALLERNCVAIYPEGERSWDGRLQRFRRGVAALARATNAAVVPAAIVGSYGAMPRGRSVRRNPISILFGAPLSPPDSDSRTAQNDFLLRLREAIAALIREGGGDPEFGEPREFASIRHADRFRR